MQTFKLPMVGPPVALALTVRTFFSRLDRPKNQKNIGTDRPSDMNNVSLFLPNSLGRYVAAGSSSNGQIFVWNTGQGELKRKLPGHESGVCGFAWGRGGSSGQQVASVDKSGVLILWA